MVDTVSKNIHRICKEKDISQDRLSKEAGLALNTVVKIETGESPNPTVETVKKIAKATAVSPANIAFIKYWGKKDSKLNIPFNNSISMNLSGCSTKTTVEFGSQYRKDRVFILGKEVTDSKRERVINIIDIIRKMACINLKSRIVSENNFPSDAGIASSASAFSALAFAGSTAAGLKLSSKDLSILARLGSGSACRSVIDGFSEWRKGKDSQTSYAIQLAPPDFWDIQDIVVIVDEKKKKVSSTKGHSATLTSPYYKTRQFLLKRRIKKIRSALLERDFDKFGQVLEEEAVCLLVMAMTSLPPIFYWNKGTIEIVQKLLEWREEKLQAYFTMDAGPNVHVICQRKDVARLNRRLKRLPEVLFTIVNKPSIGSRIVTGHLF